MEYARSRRPVEAGQTHNGLEGWPALRCIAVCLTTLFLWPQTLPAQESPEEFDAPAVALLQKGENRSELPVAATVLSFPRPHQPGFVAVLGSIDKAKLTYRQEANGDEVSDFAFVTLFRNRQGEVIRKVSQRYRLPKAAKPPRAGEELSFYAETSLDPGEYEAETAGFDAITGRAGTVRAGLTVLAEKQDLPGLSSLVLIRRMEVLPSDDQSAGSPLRYGRLLLHPWLGGELHRSEVKTLNFFLTIYPRGSHVPEQALAELLRINEPVGRLPLALPKPDLEGKIQVSGTLPLDEATPGMYTLRVVMAISDRLIARSRTFLLVP